MNGLTQTTAAKILALKEPAELEVLKIIDAAFAEHAAPHLEEVENHRQLVNETNERTAAEIKKATDTLSEKQVEILSLRDQLDDARASLDTVSNERDAIQASRNELIMAVASKHEGETRHQTALRYIVSAETLPSEPAQEA